jgi:DNA-binding transcriptional regulator YhcF (GntR family)
MAVGWIPKSFREEKCMYSGILRAIEADVSDGILRPGDILPTHRDLADTLGIAIGTVTKAYKEAERKGLIVGCGRKGTFVRSQNAEDSTLSKLVRDWNCADYSVYTLAYGARIPDFDSILKRYLRKPKVDPWEIIMD